MPDEDGPKLTPKQRAFVDAYVGSANGNATQAAREAGLAHPGVQGPRLLGNVRVRAEIEAVWQARAMAAEEVVSRLAEQARNEAARFIRVDEDGNASVDLKGLQAAGLMHLVKGIKQTRHGQVVEFYDAQAALQLLGRRHGLFTDRVKFDDIDSLIELELAKLAAGSEAAPPAEAAAAEPGAGTGA